MISGSSTSPAYDRCIEWGRKRVSNPQRLSGVSALRTQFTEYFIREIVLPISGKAGEFPPRRGKTPTEFLASFCPPIQYLPCNPYSLKECNKRSRLSDKTDGCFISRPERGETNPRPTA